MQLYERDMSLKCALHAYTHILKTNFTFCQKRMLIGLFEFWIEIFGEVISSKKVMLCWFTQLKDVLFVQVTYVNAYVHLQSLAAANKI